MSDFYSAGALPGFAFHLVSTPSKAEQAVVAVVGCGGKTTFIASLANEFRHKKVLIATSTKILPPQDEHVILRTTLAECLAHKPVRGIQCFGILDELTGKLSSLPLDALEAIMPQYDVVLIEADGSRGLPCKGWLPSEPVIPPWCTHTVGMVTLAALGKPADENTVLRLPEFSCLTGLRQSERITLAALTEMVCAGEGMFRNAVGHQCILVNKAENDTACAAAEEWLLDIQRKYPARFACLAYGSARENRWKEVSLCAKPA